MCTFPIIACCEHLFDTIEEISAKHRVYRSILDIGCGPTALNVWFNASIIYVKSNKSVTVEIACVQLLMEPSLDVLQVSKHLVTRLL